MARRLKITMAARAVIARGYDFSPREGSFADVDVALDEILSLPPPPEPLVLRATATGGDAAERTRVEGDWLYDAALGEPRRLLVPVWSYTEEATAWAKGRSWLEAWETCEDARWMLHAAACVGVPRPFIVRAACACARTVLKRIPAGEERPRRAIEAAEAWTRGETSLNNLRGAANAVNVVPFGLDGPAFSAAYAAAAAAFSSTPSYASHAVASVVSTNSEAERRRSLRSLAALVRREIPTLAVLRAAAGVR